MRGTTIQLSVGARGSELMLVVPSGLFSLIATFVQEVMSFSGTQVEETPGPRSAAALNAASADRCQHEAKG